MKVEPIKDKEVSCRNCDNFNYRHSCHYAVKNNGEDCKKFTPKNREYN